MKDVETSEYLSAAARFIRAGGRRVAETGDEPELGKLIALREVLAEAEQQAVDGMRARGLSWTYIGSSIGITRQTAQERWGAKEKKSA